MSFRALENKIKKLEEEHKKRKQKYLKQKKEIKRKNDTRIKIIIGTFVMQNADMYKEIIESPGFEKFLIQDEDRKIFGFEPLAQEEKEKRQKERWDIIRIGRKPDLECEDNPLEILPANSSITPTPEQILIKGYLARQSKNNETHYLHAETHKLTIIDKGDRLRVSRQSDEALLTALQLAKRKWGSICLQRNNDDKLRCIVLAITHDIDIRNPELQTIIQTAYANTEGVDMSQKIEKIIEPE
jgi:hypothetical protein